MRFVLVLIALICALTAPAVAENTLEVRLEGRAIDLHSDVGLEAALDERIDAFLNETITVDVLGHPTPRTRAELGVQVDRIKALRWLRGAADPNSELHAHLEGARLDLQLPAHLEIEVVRDWLRSVKADSDREARDATVNLRTGAVEAEREGRAVDVWASAEAIHDAMIQRRDQARIVVVRTPAGRAASELAGADFSVLMGDFQTPYNGNDHERTHNLRVAAQKIDGHLLLPGEVFDYNAIVGERSLANGFKPATVIAGGELVDGVGGGACQIAGSLHAAAYFAGLEIVERSPHSRPSTYIKLGLDAAVSYPNINFRFRNSKNFPVLVRLEIRGGFARAAMLGAERRHQVSFVRRIDAFAPYPERTTEDADLPRGVRVLAQRGVPGFEVTTWRIVRDVTTHQATRERDESAYPPTAQIWRVGIGGNAPESYEAPLGDQHNEYRADEYLTATQGPGVEGIQHVRRAGRTGAPGWTRRQGMPPAHPATSGNGTAISATAISANGTAISANGTAE